MHKYSYNRQRLFLFKNKKRLIGSIIILFGILSLLYFFFPLISYHVYLSSAFSSNKIEAPLPQRYVMAADTSIRNLFASGLYSAVGDSTDARNWFPQAVNREKFEKVKEYKLTIPSQGIVDAKVSADDFDLSKHLVQYFTTSENPIEKGTSVIFGHSTLPQWFDPTDYKTIFAKLHTLKNGDSFSITVDDKKYTYKIFSISITDPKDPNIFSQSFDNSYITLITCTPPGTTWKRLVVRSSLIEESSI